MTDDASPENLRKFLESDDPAMVRMGLSMAKGAGVEVTIKDLERFLKSEDVETIKTGIMLADCTDIADEFFEKAIERFIEMIEDDWEIRETVGAAIVEIGDSRAVNPLLNSLVQVTEEYWISEVIVEVLGGLGDSRAVDPLFDFLYRELERAEEFYFECHPDSEMGYEYRRGNTGFTCIQTIYAIIEILGKKAIPLLKKLLHGNARWRSELAAIGLEQLGWKPESGEEKISLLIVEKDWEVCKKMGEPAINEAIRSLLMSLETFSETGFEYDITEALKILGHEVE